MFWKEKYIVVYSTMIDTKAAFAEKAIQSLKNMVYRYIDDYGEKLVPNLNCLLENLREM